ncbi:MAG: hypothetical protein ABWZ02_03830 [Nakamurella sp.]
MALSEERYTEIHAGAERIKEEKPYEKRDDAIAALDWLTSAVTDLRGAQRGLAPSDIVQITRLASDIEVLEGLSEAIRTRMKANEQGVPGRHGGTPSDKLEVDS